MPYSWICYLLYSLLILIYLFGVLCGFQIPIIMLVVEVPQDINYSNGNSSVLEAQDAQPTNMPADNSRSEQSSSEDTSLATCLKQKKDGGSCVKSIRLDVSFKSPSHTGLQTSELVFHILYRCFHLNLAVGSLWHQ